MNPNPAHSLIKEAQEARKNTERNGEYRDIHNEMREHFDLPPVSLWEPPQRYKRQQFGR